MAWQVAAAFAFAGSLSSASQKRKAARAAYEEAKKQAAEFRRQKNDVALAATQQHENRMQQFKELVSYNEAAAAYSGRTGRSLAALRKREERLYGKDVTRLRQQEAKEKESLEKQAVATIERGQATRDAYREQARGTLLSGTYQLASLAR